MDTIENCVKTSLGSILLPVYMHEMITVSLLIYFSQNAQTCAKSTGIMWSFPMLLEMHVIKNCLSSVNCHIMFWFLMSMRYGITCTQIYYESTHRNITFLCNKWSTYQASALIQLLVCITTLHLFPSHKVKKKLVTPSNCDVTESQHDRIASHCGRLHSTWSVSFIV